MCTRQLASAARVRCALRASWLRSMGVGKALCSLIACVPLFVSGLAHAEAETVDASPMDAPAAEAPATGSPPLDEPAPAADPFSLDEPAPAELLDPPRGAFSRVMPEWEYVPDDDWGVTKRVGGRSAKIGWDFLNDTVSDSWYTASSPIRWRWREWLIVGGAAGVTTGLVFLADEPLRDAARKSERFHEYGENVRWMGQGGALLGLTGGFLISGLVLDRPKDLETTKMLLEASLIGHGYGVAMKYTAGRDRPRTGADARSFDAFSGSVSMPSGEALNVFLLAGVTAAQYPNWPVRILSYGVAGAVAAGRIGLDAHWGSDIFVSAVLGIAVGRTIVKLNRVRARDRGAQKDLELSGSATPSLRRKKGRHFVGATARSIRWTYVF